MEYIGVRVKILITGVAGFIGSHLADKFIANGHSVVGVDNFDPFYDRKIKESNLPAHETIKFFEMDLENQDALTSILKDNPVDVVIHLAAKAGVRPSLKDPLKYVDANIKATVSLMEAMKETNHNKLVFASSSSIYGECKEIPFKEDVEFDHAISVYAASKQSGELFTRMYHNLYKLDIINLRFFTVYGPRQRPDLAIHKFLKANHFGETITLFGDGSMARDYTYVADTVQGIVGATERILKNQKVYETYNLGNSTPVSLSDLIAAIEKTTGRPCEIERKDVPAGDVPITFADISKSQEYLNYNPQTTLEQGLKSMYEWIQTIY